MSRPRRVAQTVALATLLLLPAAGLAKDRDQGGRLDDAARRAAACRGLDHLQETVHRLDDPDGTPRKPFTVAIAGLCFLLDPRSSDGGDRHVRRMRDYLLHWLDDVAARLEDPDELPQQHGSFSSGRLIQYTWPVAAAGLFFGELHTRGLHREDAADALERIVAILERSQQRNGGWGHGIVSGRADDRGLPDALRREIEEKLGKDGAERLARGGGYPDTLLSSSALVAAALGLLDASPDIEVRGLPRARSYFRAARLRDGAFPYDPSQNAGGRSATGVGRTAGALWAWQALGMADDEAFRASWRYVLRRLEDLPEGHGSPCLNVLYGAMAARARGDDDFLMFREAIEPRLIAAQSEDGVLPCICTVKEPGVTCDSDTPFADMPRHRRGTDAYTTALHTLVLLLPGGRMRLLDREPATAEAVTPR